ncbi:UDP-glucose dehydrogenase family protein [Desulforamulus aquiferis]|uniref:UDP-glucose 6-dehydrogenase n=1 Tax=Desulforamulus aquiferis TaxID=1397668 RepID=A0AAW7ZFF1_9FIRM|nr:UDP-glucose/GDP-mannose dehydrogenase family protein [Desulforamulus aquiferis]MDO7788432.1 UDP-glucose/GDP-mannose dehydrogenase family protein [Desulforamulus aquiferis]
MDICTIGTGYVGLVTGTCFAEMGHNVWCVDIDEEKIKKLCNGVIPIYEPGLEEMVKRNKEEGRLRFTTSLSEAMENSLFLFIAVGTPPKEDGSADLTHVIGVAREIGKNINNYKIIINKSTVPVKTGLKVRQVIYEELLLRERTDIEFDVVSNPEFLKEGAAIEDFLRPDRIVIGTDNVRTGELMKELYSPFLRNGHQVLIMNISSAELTKYAANSMLATRISFINEISRICDASGADIEQVRLGIGSDSRIGMPFLYAGIGYGGSCFPKDVQALIRTANELGVPTEILNSVEMVNIAQKGLLVEMVVNKYGKDLSGYTFAIWGLAFKPNTDDMREAPSLEIINGLVEKGAKINAHDPIAISVARELLGEHGITYYENNYSALEGVEALLLLTEWNNYRRPDFHRMLRVMKTPTIFDGRNQYDPKKMKQMGFEYYCIGRNGNNE